MAAFSPIAGLDDEFAAWLQTSRRRVNDTFALGEAQLGHQRGSATNQYQRRLGDLRTRFSRLRERLPAGYARRGLLNSGVYGRALYDFGQDRDRAFGNLRGAYADQMGGYDMARDQLGRVRRGALDDLDIQQAARLAAASSVRGWPL